MNPNEFGWSGEWAIPFTEQILEIIGKDIRGRDREWMLSKATPWPAKYATDSITLSEKFDSVKSAYIFCTESGDPVDEIVKGKWGNLDSPYKIMETGHWPMVTKPAELVDAILSLCHLYEQRL